MVSAKGGTANGDLYWGCILPHSFAFFWQELCLQMGAKLSWGHLAEWVLLQVVPGSGSLWAIHPKKQLSWLGFQTEVDGATVKSINLYMIMTSHPQDLGIFLCHVNLASGPVLWQLTFFQHGYRQAMAVPSNSLEIFPQRCIPFPASRLLLPLLFPFSCDHFGSLA